MQRMLLYLIVIVMDNKIVSTVLCNLLICTVSLIKECIWLLKSSN